MITDVATYDLEAMRRNEGKGTLISDISDWAYMTHELCQEGGFYYIHLKSDNKRIAAMKYINVVDGVHIDVLTTNPEYRRQGLSLALIERLWADNPGGWRDKPGFKVHPGRMTAEGKALMDYLVGGEPIAQNYVGKAWLANNAKRT